MRRIELIDDIKVPERGVIARDTVRQYDDAAEIITQTSAWVTEQKDKIADFKKSECDAGRADGYRDGLAAFKKAIGDYDLAVQALGGKLEKLLGVCLNHILAELPREEVLKATITTVLDVAPQGESIIISVHPDQMAALAAALETYQTNMKDAREITCEGSADLAPEDCVVFTKSDVLSAGIPVMADQLMVAVSENLKRAKAGSK